MLIKKTFKFRLDPSTSQKELFASFAGACRFVFNRGLHQRKDAFEKDQKSISLFDQNKELTFLKKQEETLWLKTIHSQVLQQSSRDLDLAFSHFFRRVKAKMTPGYPRFKCKGEHDSFRYPQGVHVQEDTVYLPKIGQVKFFKSRDLKGDIKQTTVIQEGLHWYVCFSCVWEEAVKKVSEDSINSVGIDVGLKDFATLFDGNTSYKIQSPKFLTKHLKKLKYLQKVLSRKHKRSKNYQKAKLKLLKLHVKVKNKRNDFLHKISSKIVQNHDIIKFENLNIQKMQIEGSKSRARNIADASWRQFLTFLKYKCEYLGKIFVEAPQYFASTQMCNACGNLKKMDIRIRTYRCDCGYTCDRDINAAKNIYAVGIPV